MSKTGLKTRETEASVEDFLAGIAPAPRQHDCRTLLDMMRRVTGHEPKMWGARMVGFGRYRYKYASGRQGEWFLTGFAPGTAAMSVYIMFGFSEFGALLKRLGKHKTGKSCLYINKLEDVDPAVLEDLVRAGFDAMRRRYPS